MGTPSRLILALDTACGKGSVALADGGNIIVFKEDTVKNAQAKNLLPMMESVLQQAGVNYPDLSAIACTVGPGSFTGIRIALSAARAIALVTKVPVRGVSTLACLGCAVLRATNGREAIQSFPQKRDWIASLSARNDGAGVFSDRKITAFLSAGRGSCYRQSFSVAPFAPLGEASLDAIAAVTGENKDGLWIAAEGQVIDGLEPYIDCHVPLDARAAALIVADDALAGLILPPDPLYIRPPDAKLPTDRIAPG